MYCYFMPMREGMEYIVPVQPATFNVSPVTPTQKSADVVQHNLQPNQVVQATIAEKGEGRVLLEIRGQQMWAQTKAEVNTGQQLNLQVVSTEPRLQLQIVPQGLEKHMLRLIPLFGQQPQLGASLQQINQTLDAKVNLPQLHQLAHQLLGQRPPPIGAELAQATRPLQETLVQLQTTSQNVRMDLGKLLQTISLELTRTSAGGVTGGGVTGGADTSAVAAQIITKMAGVLAEIFQAPHPSTQNIPQIAPSGLDKNLAAQLERILAPLFQPTSGQKSVTETLQQVRTLLEQLPTSTLHANTLPPEAGTDQSKHQTQVLGATLMQAMTQTIGMIQQHMTTPPARELALLAQVLGLNFEGRLLKGEAETARNSLKGILLQLQNKEDIPEQVRASSAKLLQQLELFQLCRARLAEDGVQFLPLPFDFLQQGYALIEEHGHGQQDDAEKPENKSHCVTLNLALEHLGTMNINMLFEQGKLYVRISCANPGTIALVEGSRQDLNSCLQPLGLQRLNIDAGAQDPATALLERLSTGKAMLSTQA